MAMLAIVLAVLFGIGLGNRPFSAPSESRYIEIGREMAESGDFVTPKLDYVKYFEKPPLFYWVQAETTKIFGLDPFAVRAPTAAFAILLCLLTYFLGDILYGRLTAWLSSMVLATSLYMFALSRVVLVDVPVSVFLVMTLSLFLYVARTSDGRKRVIALYLMYAAAACAVLTKGLIGAVLPGAVVLIWLALTGNWKVLATLRLPSGIALFFALSVPWHVLVSMRNPEFPHFYFVHEHFERYLTKAHGRYQPDWFFVIVLLAGLFPWIVFALQSFSFGLKNTWKERFTDGTKLYLVIWASFIFIFFSLSDSKLIPYILPIFPPLCVLIGNYLAEAWNEKSVPYFRTGVVSLLLVLLAMTVTPSILPQVMDADSKVMEAVSQAGDDLRNLSIAAIISAGALLIGCIQAKRRHIIMMIVVVAAVIIQCGDLVSAHYNKDSMAGIADVIKTLERPGSETVLYDEYYQDLPVYLRHKVSVVSWQGSELHFGAEHQDASGWMINEKELWKRWLANDHLMFLVMREDAFKRLLNKQKKSPDQLHLHLLTQAGRNMLFVNRNPETLRK